MTVLHRLNSQNLPPIPNKIYFTIGEVSDLCLVKPYVLRYWEQEFPHLRPSTRRGNRRYYQRTDILLIRKIKDLLYEQGFTIDGARTKLNNDNKSRQENNRKDVIKFAKDTISCLHQILSELK